MARKSKLFQARDHNKTVRDVRDERDTGYAKLVSYGGRRPSVAMRWDLSRAAKQDQIFELQIGSERALVSAEEILRYLRWV